MEVQKDSYIVILKLKKNNPTTDCARENYCFKQREDSYCIAPLVDLRGTKFNFNSSYQFDTGIGSYISSWRYANDAEVEEYDRLGKPYDVTTLLSNDSKPKYFAKGTYVVSLKDGAKNIPGFYKGTVVKIKDVNKIEFNNTEWSCSDEADGVKWFATLKEAQKFSDDLIRETRPGYFAKGTYVVSLVDNAISISGFNKGCIAEVIHKGLEFKNKNYCGDAHQEKDGLIKWFATLKEAQKFSTDLTLNIKPKPKFVIGKWYKNLGEEKKHIAKFNGFINEIFSSSSHIYKGDFYGDNCSNFTRSFENAVEIPVTSPEIQEFLPPNHPDKIKEKEVFYIKYDPSITEDQFDQLCTALTARLGKPYIHCCIPITYESFKKPPMNTNPGFIRTGTTKNGGPGWCIDNNRQGISNEKFIYDFIDDKETSTIISSSSLHLVESKGQGIISYNPGLHKPSISSWIHQYVPNPCLEIELPKTLNHQQPHVLKTSRKSNKFVRPTK
jgi:hypothetical protein